MPDDISITWTDGNQELVINGVRYFCSVKEPVETRWHFPVGEGDYPPERWYCAQYHDLATHTGLDLNLAFAEFGDVERRLGLSIHAIAGGVVTYATQDWSGVPMCVIRHVHEGEWLWVRYAHVDTNIPMVGTVVNAGYWLGGFANWKTGDHLHLDMALDPFAREWLDPNIRWQNPVGIFKAHLDPVIVDAMLRKGA